MASTKVKDRWLKQFTGKKQPHPLPRPAVSDEGCKMKDKLYDEGGIIEVSDEGGKMKAAGEDGTQPVDFMDDDPIGWLERDTFLNDLFEKASRKRKQ